MIFDKKSRIYNIAHKVLFKKPSLQHWKKLNGDIMKIVESINDIKEDINVKDASTKLKALEYAKNAIEKKVLEIEESFYDSSKGLWIGLAIDLDDLDRDYFLLYLPWKNLHNHIQVFGTSGYGKSRLMALMIRQFLHFGWSTFVSDPKGGEKQEIAQWMYDFAAETGQNHKIMRIMATYPSISDKGNPLFGQSDVEIASTCASLTLAGTSTASSDEQFFSGQVYRIVYSICSSMSYLEVAMDPYKLSAKEQIIKEVKKYRDFKENKGTQGEFASERFSFPDVSEMALANQKGFTTKYAISPYNRTLLTFRELSFYCLYDNLKLLHAAVKATPVPILKEDINKEDEINDLKVNALRAIDEAVNIEKAFYEKTGMSLSVLLSQLAYGPIGSITCDIRINPIIKRAREKGGIILLFQPAPMRFEKVSEMLMKVYTRMWLSLFGTVGSSGRGLKKRVVMIMDEHKTTLNPDYVEISNKARELGMTLLSLYQSRSDVKFKLGEILGDILQDNTATTISMKQVSHSSKKEMSESFGYGKIASNMQMTEIGGAGGRSTIVYEDREFVSVRAIDKLGIGEAFVQHYGKNYFVKLPYQRDPYPIKVVMPKLESEEAYEFIEKLETYLNIQEENRKTINSQHDNNQKQNTKIQQTGEANG